MDSIECHPMFKKLKVELRDLKRDNRNLEKELAEAARENGILNATTDHACAKHIMLTNEKKKLTRENKLLVSDNNFLEDEIAMLKADEPRQCVCDSGRNPSDSRLELYSRVRNAGHDGRAGRRD